MDIFEGKKMTDETLSGVSSVSQPNDDNRTILKPEETVGHDLGVVVVTTKLFEKTEISVAKEDELMQNQEQGEGNEAVENVTEGLFGNLVDDEVVENVTEGLFGNLVDDEVVENVKEGIFGNLVDDDDDNGMYVNCSENVTEEIFGNLVDDNGMDVDCIENVKEGIFGNLVDDDDDDNGVDVNCSENGTAQAMDVEGSLAEDNAGSVNLVSEGNAGVLGDEHGENSSEVPMDISLQAENEQNNENGTRIFESQDVTNKNDDETGETREDKGGELVENEEGFNGELGESEVVDLDFVVGDFVWGEVKSQQWWPGQIYDPSDASDNAVKLKHEGRLLVVYFGDGSFSWSSPSQLKPFIDHFPEMSKQSDSRKFVNAVKMALEEVRRLVEMELMCKCQTVDRIVNAGVVNRGIKEGVRSSKGRTIKVLVDRMVPVELLSTLKASATMDQGTRLAELELMLLKSCLNVFYGKKGGYFLAEYRDPMCIEGLEDATRSGVVADSDINGSLESIDNGNNKSHQRRKQKSVTELMLDDEPKVKKAKTTKAGCSGNKKRKALVVSVTPESDHESGGAGVEEAVMSPRERKKSKYLSPPYLSPIGSAKLSGSGSFKEPKAELEKYPEMAAKHLEDSLKSSGKKAHQKGGASEGSDPQEEQKMMFNVAVNVDTVLQVLVHVALDPTSFVEQNLPVVADFISSYRRSVYKEGSTYPTERKKKGGDTPNIVIKKKLGSDRKKIGGCTSDVAFIKQKLESMLETVQGCEETEISADVKASLEGGIQEVLQKVAKMKGK